MHDTIEDMFETLLHSVSIFSLLPGLDLVDFVIGLGIFAVLFVIFAESGLLIGFFLPGDSLLFTSGAFYATGILPGNVPINIHLFAFLLFLAAVLGDTVGYWFGRKAGPRVFKKPDARIFRQSHIQNAQKFYEKHGGKTIILARFMPVIRTFAPIVAGVGKMSYPRFLSFNLVGGFLWTYGLTYLGYFAGKAIMAAGIEIDYIILPIVILIIIVSILPPAIQILKDKKNRQAIWYAAKKQFQIIFSSKK